MPFNLRHFEDVKKARLGVMECVSHSLVSPYPVLWEKAGELVAQFKYTVLVMPNGPMKITGLPFDTSLYQSDVNVNDNEEVKVRAPRVSSDAMRGGGGVFGKNAIILFLFTYSRKIIYYIYWTIIYCFDNLYGHCSQSET